MLLRALVMLPVLAVDFRLSRLKAALTQAPGAGLSRLIDAHCHVFNLTDLPATRFISIVKLKHYRSETRHDPGGGLLESLIRRAIDLLRSGALTAAEEAREIETRSPSPLAQSPRSLSTEQSVELGRLRGAIERQERLSTAAEAPPGRPLCEKGGATASSNVRTALRWLGTLTARRGLLVDRLLGLHRASGYETRLLCPALVDYSCWLGERLWSPLPDQVRAMKAIALRPEGPAVHAYVAFDPLRDALFRRRLQGPDGDWDPLALVESALTDGGCIGVKLYPPMGFRPSGNEASVQSYPYDVVSLFGSAATLGRELDTSLERLWALCRRLDVGVLAHAFNSFGSGPRYAERADPAFWMSVLNPARPLRVLLAHFGPFKTMSAGQWPQGESCPAETPFERTWEAVFARHVRDQPESPVFADISYFSEIFHDSERQRIAAHMRNYLCNYDPEARHLIFGSDWNLIGIEKEFARRGGYARRVAAFLAECDFDDAQIARVMHGNALRFLGLGEGEATRARLDRFYVANGRSSDRLAAI